MQSHFMEQFRKIVYEAGEIILSAESITVEKQKDGLANFVTKYDTMVQAFLIDQLKHILPEAAFLGEEEGQCASPADEKYCFIIDPIDGTTNFLCDFQYSAISVALSTSGKLTHGIVYNPFRKEMFWCERGKGAFLNDRKLSYSDKTLSEGVFIFGTTPYNPEFRSSAFDMAKEVSYLTMDLRELGSAALNFCYVACGRAVGFASPRLFVWDYAAAAVLLEELGYPLSDFDGKPMDFRTKVSIAATTPSAFKQFLEISKKYANCFK